MKQLENCILCGEPWKEIMFQSSDGLVLSSYYCDACVEQISIVAEDKSA